MSRKDLPLDSGARIYKVFEDLGFEYRGLSESNHYILTHPDDPYLILSVPKSQRSGQEYPESGN